MDANNKKTLFQVAHVSSVGIGMAVAIFGALFIGVYLDGKFGTGPYLAVIFLVMGIIAGFRNYFRLVKRYGIDLSPLKAAKKDDKAPPGNET